MECNQKFIIGLKFRYVVCITLACFFGLLFHTQTDTTYKPPSNQNNEPKSVSYDNNRRTSEGRYDTGPDDDEPDERVRRCDSDVRQTVLAEYCKSTGVRKLDIDAVGYSEILSLITYYMVVDDKHETIYCDVPKAASSTWMTFLLREGLPRANASIDWAEYPIHEPPAQRDSGIRHIPGYKVPEIKYRLKNYFKFLVVRHPLERLVSAYNDKFVKTEFGYGIYYRAYILDHFRKGVRHHPMTFYIEQEEEIRKYVIKEARSIPEQYLDGRTVEQAVEYYWGYHQPFQNGVEEYLVTFKEFIMFYLNVTEELKHDHHWQAIVELCRPCLFSYDLIGKVETLKDDSHAIMTHMNISHTLRYPHLDHMRHYREPSHSSVGSSSDSGDTLRLEVLDAFKSLGPDLLAKVLDMVKDDLAAFGYSWDTEQFVSTCTSEWHNHTCC